MKKHPKQSAPQPVVLAALKTVVGGEEVSPGPCRSKLPTNHTGSRIAR
jgi:hypothetical protein